MNMSYQDKKIVITGGAGFIGSAVVRQLLKNTSCSVINVDKLTYAGNLESLASIETEKRYFFEKIDICDVNAVERIFSKFQPDMIMHLAAESHVDRSIDSSREFVDTNILGTFVLLEESRKYWSNLKSEKKENFRFHHVSTDEVYGELPHPDEVNVSERENLPLFTEKSCYSPNSPYSATKAASDHLVRAWHRTYGLPTIVTNCSNNYGPYQFPEKLIPLVILNALEGKQLPVYGNGNQIRDWLYVEDHADALVLAITHGKVGETYNIGGHNERKNIEVIKTVCKILNELVPVKNNKVIQELGLNIVGYESLIAFVEDRPGHDKRYAIDSGKFVRELGWTPSETFESGIRKTVNWYLANLNWCRHVQDGTYRRERLGVKNW